MHLNPEFYGAKSHVNAISVHREASLLFTDRRAVETLTTGEAGSAQSSLLYLGRYRLEERQAPEGMVLNTEPEYVELIYAGETVEVTQAAVGLYDERQKLFRGSRVGQLVIMPVVIVDFVSDLGEGRGKGAFGSTGK